MVVSLLVKITRPPLRITVTSGRKVSCRWSMIASDAGCVPAGESGRISLESSMTASASGRPDLSTTVTFADTADAGDVQRTSAHKVPGNSFLVMAQTLAKIGYFPLGKGRSSILDPGAPAVEFRPRLRHRKLVGPVVAGPKSKHFVRAGSALAVTDRLRGHA